MTTDFRPLTGRSLEDAVSKAVEAPKAPNKDTIGRMIAKSCMFRYNALSTEYGKGKKRDQLALDYFSGAYKALVATGQSELAEALGMAIQFDVSIRGWKAVELLAAE